MGSLLLLVVLSVPARAQEVWPRFGRTESTATVTERPLDPALLEKARQEELQRLLKEDHLLLRERILADVRRLDFEPPTFRDERDELRGVPLMTWPRSPKSTSTGGLRIQGIDITDGLDPDHSAEDPFISPGIDRLLDWDVRLKVKQSDIGVQATYRNPTWFERLTVSVKKEMDTFEEFGVGGVRDRVLGLFGRDKEDEKKDGFKVDLAAAVDEYWGFGLAYGQSERTKADAWSFSRTESASLGFSPLGRNEGKPWNYSLFAGVNHRDLDSTGTDAKGRQSGWGYSAGAAFQHALDAVDFPVIGRGSKEGFSFDKFRASLTCADSEIADLSVRAALELSCRVTRHLRLTCGAECTWLPDLNTVDFGPTFGAGLHW